MDRRELLKLGALAGATGLTSGVGEGCLLPSLLFDNEPEALPNMDLYLAVVDRGLEHIEGWNPPAGPSGAVSGSTVDPLNRKAVKTLFLTAMFSDLPAEGQAHPGIQDRMWSAVPDFNDAVFGMADRLRSRTPERWKRLQTTLQGPGNPGMLLAEKLDEHAVTCGLSRRRRLQTRTMFAHIDGRLRKQPPGLLVDEVLTKVDKLRSRGDENPAFRQELRRRFGEAALREHEWRLAAWLPPGGATAATLLGAKQGPAGLTVVEGGSSQGEPPAAQPEAEPQTTEETSGSDVLTAGLIVMGVSFGVSLIALPVFYASPIGAFVMWTVGGILLLAGLITTIIGSVMD